MTVALNSRPRAILNGVKDETGGVLGAVLEALPTHLPHIFIYAEEGETKPQVLSGDARLTAYGPKTFDYNYHYANHQTVLANVVNGNGNAALYQRIQPVDAAPPATIRVSADVLETQIPLYQRDDEGNLVLDGAGMPQPTGETVQGFKIKFVTGQATGGIAQGAKVVGSMTDADGVTQSQIWPLFDAQVPSFGNHGNNKGFRIWAPTTRSGIPTDEGVILDNNAFTYRMQMIKRTDTKSQPFVVQTLRGSQYIDIALKPGAKVKQTGQLLHVNDAVLPNYRDVDASPMVSGNFSEFYIYQDFVDELLALMYAEESQYHPEWPETADEGKYLINLFGAVDHNAIPYTAIKLAGISDGGVTFGQFTNHFAAGGSDGTMSNELFAEAVRQQTLNFGELEYPLLDSATYPMSVYWDTGFPMETKKALMHPVGKRKDIAAIICTQDVDAPQNSAEAEAATLMALRSYARNFLESEIFGTPACRIAIVGHSGKLINSDYKGLLPLTIDLADKVSRYMGASNGVWRTDQGFDESPRNQVTMFRDINLTYKPESAANSDWALGLISCQAFDTKRFFYPGFQTVYDDKTSALNSLINMFTFGELEKVCERNWRRMSGGHGKLTAEQFIEKSNDDILNDVEGRFDDRYIIEANTYFTDIDTELGYAYSVDIVVYTNDNKHVGTYTIIARDRAQLSAA